MPLKTLGPIGPRAVGERVKTFLSISLVLEKQNSETESLGLASANFAMEYEPLFNRAGALYFCTLYSVLCTTVYRKEGLESKL